MTVLQGRSAIITGGNQGLGLAIAEAYLRAGANILLCARGADALARAKAQLDALDVAGRVEIQAADVSDHQQATGVVARALDAFGKVEVLVNNAGVYGPKGRFEEQDPQAWITGLHVNLLGSAWMCHALIPHLRHQGYGKIVQLSGGGATAPLPRLSCYAASKAAVVRLAETLAEELKDAHVDVNCIAPGALNTRLLEEVLQAGPEKVGEAFYNKAVAQKEAGGIPLQKGADLAVYLGSAASNGITGKLISAVWDPWETLAEHLEELRQSDIYTLRRIIPKERGKAWGDR